MTRLGRGDIRKTNGRTCSKVEVPLLRKHCAGTSRRSAAATEAHAPGGRAAEQENPPQPAAPLAAAREWPRAAEKAWHSQKY